MIMKDEFTPQGIKFDYEITGLNGARFMLFPEKQHTKKDIQNAKVWLKNTRDVVSIKVCRK